MAVGDLGSVGFGKAGSGWRVRREGEDELYHYAVKGQKRGVRRYQNEDGSYTAAGREHYGIGNDQQPARQDVAPKVVRKTRSAVSAQKAASTRTNNPVGRYGRGNIDLNNRKVVRNEDGSISTERSFSVNIDGKEVLLPTVINGRVVSEDEAIDNYFRTGKHLGKFNTVEEAEEYAERLHNRQDRFYNGPGMSKKRLMMLLHNRRLPSRRKGPVRITKTGTKAN